jgi:hypothetical protein
MREFFAANPSLQDEVLTYLARDARNAGLVMALAGNSLGRAGAAEVPTWQTTLLAALVERGEFGRARDLWLKIAGLRNASFGLFNPQFAKLNAPAPFNWTLSSGDFGVAEAIAAGGLQIVYYGRTDANLATQLLLLSPGSYELRMTVVRQADTQESSGLSWSLSCRPGEREILKLPISGSGAPQRVTGEFTVPANCPAQLLKLAGAAQELAASEQAVITDLALVRGKR